MTTALYAWVLAILTSLRPAPAMPGHAETPEAYASRLETIAADVVAISFDPAERPVPGQGPHARKYTAALIIALSYMESGLAHDVDIGPCHPQRDPKTGLVRCDGGASACMMQVKVGRGSTREGWTREDLFADRRKCFRAGLAIARRSFGKCARAGRLALLNAYASGDCARGGEKGRDRLELTDRLFAFPGRPVEADVVIAPSSGAAGHAASAP